MKETLYVSTRFFTVFFLTIGFLTLGLFTNIANAHGGCRCGTISGYHSTTRQHVCDCYDNRMDEHENWILNDFWPIMEEALKGAASQETQGAATTLQSQHLAQDATNLINTQRERQTQTVETQRRFGGAEHAVCTPASIGQGRSASEELARGGNSNITQAMLNNAVGSTDGRSFNGAADDRARRFQQLTSNYCRASDFGGRGADLGCSAGDRNANLDISFGELYSGRDTNGDGKIDASDLFGGTIDTDTERQAWDAFKSNLGLQLPFDNIAPDAINPSNMAAVRDVIMQQRQYLARRSVALASFNNLESLQSEGTSAATEYLRGMYEEQGRDSSVIPANPSAYQQQKLTYHDYYADSNELIQELTDSPENVARHSAMALFHINAQLWNITDVLRRIDVGLAANALPSLNEEYQQVQDATQRISRAQ